MISRMARIYGAINMGRLFRQGFSDLVFLFMRTLAVWHRKGQRIEKLELC